MSTYTFSDRSGRFRDSATGQYVSERAVRDAVDAVVRLSGERMADLAQQFRAGTIDDGQFLTSMISEIKSVHVATALAAYGGREQVTQARWGTVGQLIRQQYAYARQMVADVLEGRQRMNGRLDARSRMYAAAGRTAYENIRRREMAALGYAFEVNVQHSQEGCRECVAASDLGPVPIGTLPPIGSRQCRSMCLCTISFSRTRQDAEAA